MPYSGSKQKKVLFFPLLTENPYQTSLISALTKYGIKVHSGSSMQAVLPWGTNAPAAVHIHWLPKFSAGVLGWLRLVLYVSKLWFLRLFRVRIVWTAHNLYSHEAQWRGKERFLTRAIIRVAHAVIVHSPAAISIIANEFKVRDTAKFCVIWHGNYIGTYPNTISREEARAQLIIAQDHLVYLFLGFIRPYKGVSELVSAFKHVTNPAARLLIVGRPLNELTLSELNKLIQGDTRITIKPEFVEDDRLQIYLNAADVAVYPYKDVLTSGAVVLGMSFGKACIAPKVGCIPDYLDSKGAFLYSADDNNSMQVALNSAGEVTAAQLAEMGKFNFKKAQTFDWDSIAALTAKQYK